MPGLPDRKWVAHAPLQREKPDKFWFHVPKCGIGTFDACWHNPQKLLILQLDEEMGLAPKCCRGQEALGKHLWRTWLFSVEVMACNSRPFYSKTLFQDDFDDVGHHRRDDFEPIDPDGYQQSFSTSGRATKPQSKRKNKPFKQKRRSLMSTPDKRFRLTECPLPGHIFTCVFIS